MKDKPFSLISESKDKLPMIAAIDQRCKGLRNRSIIP